MNWRVIAIVTAALFPLLIAVLNEVRNHWFWDKRTNAYSRITVAILLLWGCFIPLAGIATYLQLNPPIQPTEKPEWQFIVDRLLVPTNATDCSMYIPVTNDQRDVVFGVKNVGRRGVEHLVITIQLPSSTFCSVGDGWTSQPSLSATNGKLNEASGNKAYSQMSQSPIGTEVAFVCGPITFKELPTNGIVIKTYLAASASEGQIKELSCWLNFVPGLKESYLKVEK